MSAWRMTVHRLYSLGGQATLHQLDDGSNAKVYSALYQMLNLGLATHVKRSELWVITQKGIQFCEGRITYIRNSKKRIQFVCTWILSLPQGIHINQTDM